MKKVPEIDNDHIFVLRKGSKPNIIALDCPCSIVKEIIF